MTYKLSIAAIGTAVLALGTVTISAAPATAAKITFDTTTTISGTSSVTPPYVPLAALLSLPNGPFSTSISHSFTLDDDPNQYLDGDISLGLDLLLGAIGFEIDPDAIAVLNDFLDFNFSGSGTLSNGTESLAFNLSYDETNSEGRATFVNFDPNNNFIASCFVSACTTSGNFALNIIGTPAIELLGAWLGLELPPGLIASANGNFSTIATPKGNGGTGGNGENPPQSIPEPTTFLGLFGVGTFLAARGQRSRVA
jgi:hypothetical protein